MDEAEWNASDDPVAMLWFVTENPDHQNITCVRSLRKLRLFAVACCRQVWDGSPCGRCGGSGSTGSRAAYLCPDCRGVGRVGGLTDPRSRQAVEVAERFADGGATERELAEASLEVQNAGNIDWAAYPAVTTAKGAPIDIVFRLCWELSGRRNQLPAPAVQADLLRDLCGNPFKAAPLLWRNKEAFSLAGPIVRYPKPIKRGVCLVTSEATYDRTTWLTPAVLAVARTIYDERRWQDCPILADALEDAGCDNADILGHLRNEFWCVQCGDWRIPCRGKCSGCGCTVDLAPRTHRGWIHARGCWAVDLILGKE